MAPRSASCFIIILLCISLFLNPALAKGKGRRHNRRPSSAPPPPPPPPTDVLSPPTFADVSGDGHRFKGHHGKKKHPNVLSQPPSMAPSPSESPFTVSPAVSPSMAPSPSESPFTASPAVSPAAPEVSRAAIAFIVKSNEGKSFTDHICELSANPKQCDKILEGKDETYIESLPVGTTTLLSIELSAGVASKAVNYMTDKIVNNNIDITTTTCIDNYQDSIVGFTGAYANFTADPTAAKQSLNSADVKIGFCETSLASGEPRSFLPQMDDTNKLLRSLIQLVLKEFPQ